MSKRQDSTGRFFQAMRGPAGTDEHAPIRARFPHMLEADLAGEDVGELFPDVLAHLDRCPECDREYAVLLELALAEERGELPVPADIPAVRLPAPVRLQRLAQSIAAEVVQALDPRHAQERIEQLELIAGAFARQLSKAPGRLTYTGVSTGLAFNLGGGGDNPALQALMASYYALRDVVESHSPAELQEMDRTGALEQELRQIAEREARLAQLGGKRESLFVEHFVRQAQEDASVLIELAGEGPGDGPAGK